MAKEKKEPKPKVILKQLEKVQFTELNKCIVDTITMELMASNKVPKELKEYLDAIPRDMIKPLYELMKLAQKNKIQHDNRLKAYNDLGKEAVMIRYATKFAHNMEEQYKVILESAVKGDPVGQWLMSLQGVAEVTTGGLLTYLDIKKANTAGSFFAYAGIAPRGRVD